MSKRTKVLIGLACAAALNVQGAIFEFELGPVDATGAGMHGANTVAGNTSKATGGELSTRDPLLPGISYNDETRVLSIHIGWGTDYGFTDLQGPPTILEVGGPTSVPRFEANTIYKIFSSDLGFQGESGRDGTYRSDLALRADPQGHAYSIMAQEADLLAGLWYLNLRTSSYPGGEIRGQLVPVPEPETWGLLAGLGLLGFGVYRRWSVRTTQGAA